MYVSPFRGGFCRPIIEYLDISVDLTAGRAFAAVWPIVAAVAAESATLASGKSDELANKLTHGQHLLPIELGYVRNVIRRACRFGNSKFHRLVPNASLFIETSASHPVSSTDIPASTIGRFAMISFFTISDVMLTIFR